MGKESTFGKFSKKAVFSKNNENFAKMFGMILVSFCIDIHFDISIAGTFGEDEETILGALHNTRLETENSHTEMPCEANGKES